MINPLQNLGVTPFSLNVIQTLYPGCRHISDKAIRLEKEGEIIRLKRDLYVVRNDREMISRELVANHLYGPSYVSMGWALRRYGLIPERVHLLQSVTTKHSRKFSNALGDFHYHHCSSNYFSIGVDMQKSGSVQFLIATPAKALCDYICFHKIPLRYMTDVRAFLEEDLRFDMQALPHLNVEIIGRCCETGSKSQSLFTLLKFLHHEFPI